MYHSHGAAAAGPRPPHPQRPPHQPLRGHHGPRQVGHRYLHPDCDFKTLLRSFDVQLFPHLYCLQKVHWLAICYVMYLKILKTNDQ